MPSPDAETEQSTYLVAARTGEEMGRQSAERTTAAVNSSDFIIDPADRGSMVTQRADPLVPYIPRPMLTNKVFLVQDGSRVPTKRSIGRRRSRKGQERELSCVL
jgi:hypothetical protein